MDDLFKIKTIVLAKIKTKNIEHWHSCKNLQLFEFQWSI